MGTIPENKSAGESLNASEANDLRDLGYVVTLLLGEDIAGGTLPVPAYVKVSDGKLYKCDGNDQATLEFQGFVIDTDTSGNAAQLQTSGVVGGFSGLSIGSRYYVQDSVGTIGTSIGTYEIYVGIAISSTQILIDKGPRAQMQYMGTASEGGGSITSPAGARMAIITFSVVANAGDGSSNSGTIVIMAKGSTSGSSTSKSGSATSVGASASWSGTTITISYSGATPLVSSSATAYFYR